MRALAAGLLLLAATAAPLRAEPPSDPLNWLGGPIAAHLFVLDMDDRGLPRWPHDAVDDIKNGAGLQWWSKFGRHFTEGSRQGSHLLTGFRTEGRIGAEFEFTHYDAGAFGSRKRPDLMSLRGTADLSRTDEWLLEYGFGITSLWAERTFFGISASFSLERRLRKPWTAYARYSPGLLAHTSLLHDVQVGVGANWKAIGVEAGYRALVNGLRNVYGPETSLRLSF
jgi:hypothetical protein